MVAAGFLGKEFVRWQRDGRYTHIFNPSAFSLGLFSLVLIGTGTTDLTWGQAIASTLTLAPHIYVFLFLIGLVVMYAFSITLVAGSAAAVLFGSSALYSAVTGVPYFIDSEIPSAVFLGLHLLVTDPSTSPKTPLGKSLFGVSYGLGVFGIQQQTGLKAAEGRDFIETYFGKYPGIQDYIERTKADAARDGYVQTLLGRRRYIPEVQSNNHHIKSAGERMAINMPIQGTAADIIKLAMVRIQKEIDKLNLRSLMIIQVHDLSLIHI